jgi:uncharacterized protein YutE (UPF0331/DUF86 family)
MIAVDRALVKSKLADLHKAVTMLRALQVVAFEEFASNQERVWAVEHGLQVCIQIVLDLGDHLLASRGENKIDDYTSVIVHLGDSAILPRDFSERIKPMAGFRNLLVHEYATVDLKEVYRVLQEGIDDFETFGRHVESWLNC